MEKHGIITSINNLPDEIITLILVNSKTQDIIHFGLTCKQFYEIVCSNDWLWKKKYSQILSTSVQEIAAKHGDGDWFREISDFYKLKQTICNILITLSPKHYWTNSKLSLKHLELFFSLATDDGLKYYYVIHILQDIVKKGYAIIDTKQCVKEVINK